MSVNIAWMDRALCVGADPDIWFDGRQRAEAQRICAACPVADACRAAGAEEYRGVWGGEPHMRKKVGRSPSADYIGYRHGTDAGYSRHLREGTPPCGSCSTAHMFGNRKREATRVRTPEQLAEQKARRQRREAEPVHRPRARVYTGANVSTLHGLGM